MALVLGLACVFVFVAMAVAPGVLVAAVTRDRWDRGRHGRRFLIAGINAAAASTLLTVAFVALFVVASMNDDRGADIDGWPLLCCGFWIVALPLGFVPLFLLRRPRAPEAIEPLSPELAGDRAAARIRRARAGFFVALSAYLPAWFPLLVLFAGRRWPGAVRATLDYGSSCGGGLAFVLNLIALGLAISALRGPKSEERPKLLAGGTIALAILGALGSPGLIVLSWLIEGFAHSIGAVH